MPAVINNLLCLPVHCNLVEKVHSLAPPIHTFRERDSCSFIVLAYALTAEPQIQTAQWLQAQTLPNKHTGHSLFLRCLIIRDWGITVLLGSSCAFTELICAVESQSHTKLLSECQSMQLALHHFHSLCRSLFFMISFMIQSSIILNSCRYIIYNPFDFC